MKNPPAFPTGTDTNSKGLTIEDSQGMTLRDYFAAAAMQTLLRDDAPFDTNAKEAYRMADAMLKAREQ